MYQKGWMSRNFVACSNDMTLLSVPVQLINWLDVCHVLMNGSLSHSYAVVNGLHNSQQLPFSIAFQLGNINKSIVRLHKVGKDML